MGGASLLCDLQRQCEPDFNDTKAAGSRPGDFQSHANAGLGLRLFVSGHGSWCRIVIDQIFVHKYRDEYGRRHRDQCSSNTRQLPSE